MKQSHLLPGLALATTVIIWSITPSLVRAFAQETGPGEAIAIRMWTNAAFSLPFLLIIGAEVARKDWLRFAAIGIIGNFGYYIGSNYGFANLSAGAGGMVYATNPLMIAALAIAAGSERLSLPVLLGLLISFAGTVYLFADGLGGGTGNPVFGGVMMLLGCASWAVYVVFSRPLIVKYGPVRVTLWCTVLCALPSLAFASPQTLTTAWNLSNNALVALLLMSLVGTIFSVNLWNYAAGHLPPTSVGASLYLIPPCIALFGWLFFGEATGMNTLIGGLIILAGVAVAEFGKTFLPAKATA
ncbi:MAG: DMT family transporter [Alphaproteobacteria bacterium]|nr:DMT family transporter [Alphaproteobacteria bacterium]